VIILVCGAVVLAFLACVMVYISFYQPEIKTEAQITATVCAVFSLALSGLAYWVGGAT
jgi:NADH:ubiquinone oxidoreductase subunit 6 (subunit J)